MNIVVKFALHIYFFFGGVGFCAHEYLLYCNLLSKQLICRFDYIVRDSRACGLGCNFDFQRLRTIDDFLLSSFFFLFMWKQNLQMPMNSHCFTCRLLDTMQVLDDEICYRAKECQYHLLYTLLISPIEYLRLNCSFLLAVHLVRSYCHEVIFHACRPA